MKLLIALFATAIITTGVATHPPTAHAASQNPLFQKMEGHWIGRGLRIQTSSGHRIAIEAEVESRIDESNPARLVSRNRLRETAPDGATRAYSKSYWIHHLGGTRYQLGGGGEQPLIEAQPAQGTFLRGALPANGVFVDDTFTVEQPLGGTDSLRLESITRFEPHVTHFYERLLDGNRTLSETRIDYERTAGENTADTGTDSAAD